ncbi:hypothetical protein TWF694_008984 [Orbilia ellipsospora]|uniref:Uncharacterized protein n=1 Tax=Orbilia ellipsospora TaxID=2528407 RepID=A0AAV9XE35_9PEZI
MRVVRSILLFFLGALWSTSTRAYQIAWGGVDTTSKYVDVLGAADKKTPPCYEIPEEIGVPADIYIRTTTSEKVPKFIALHTLDPATQAQGCVPENLATIFAFYPGVTGLMQGAYINAFTAFWWREINPASIPPDYTASLIKNLDLQPGGVAMKYIAPDGTSGWSFDADSQVYLQDYNFAISDPGSAISEESFEYSDEA